MFSRLFGIAFNTLTEVIRQPIYGVMLFVTAATLVMCLPFSAFTLEDDNLILREFGLSTLLICGLFLAAFSATGVVSREIENRTVLTVISKPVSRPVFILGKFFGLTGALSVAFYLYAIIFLLIVRHQVLQNATDPYDLPVIIFGCSAALLTLGVALFCNYFYGANFVSLAVVLAVVFFTAAMALVCLFDKNWNVQPFGKDFLDGQVLGAVWLVYLAVLLLTAVALAASTRLGQVMTLVVCTGVLLVGVVSDYLFGEAAENPEGVAGLAGAAAYHVVPNIRLFWVADAMSAGKTIDLGYVGLTTAYAALLIAATLLLAIALFQRREVG